MTHAASADHYERLAEAELRLAGAATDKVVRGHHLNRAAVYAYQSEQAHAVWKSWDRVAA